MKRAPARAMMIGIGNPDRGDDAAGRAVARLLRSALPADFEVTEHDGEATSLLSRLDHATAAIMVDACASGAAAGTVRRFDVAASPLPQALFGASTHGFGVAAAIELGRALGRLPPCCIVYAIEGQCFEFGAPLSPAVSLAVADLARRLTSEIGRLCQSAVACGSLADPACART